MTKIEILKKSIFAICVLLLGLTELFAQALDTLWSRVGIDDSSRYGAIVFALGDQDDDGYADWGINSPSAWPMYPESDASHSKVELFHGGDPPSYTPYWTFSTVTDSIYWVAGGYDVGDLNGDGLVDWMIAALPTPETQYLVYNFYLGGSTPGSLPEFTLNATFQISFDGLGDFNGDGYDDLIRRDFDALAQMVYWGGDPMDTIPDWIVHDEPGYYQSALPEAWGDLNGDGYADFIGSYDIPGQRVYWGSVEPDTIPEIFAGFTTNNSERWIIRDLNGDSADELLIPRGGTIDVHLGTAQLSATPDYILETPGGCSVFPVLSLGDINRDGYNDMLSIGDGNGACALTVFGIHLGHPWLNPEPAITMWGELPPYELVGIYNGAGLGDVNGDSMNDFIIGCWNHNFNGMRGRAVIFAGDTSLIVSTDNARPEIPDDLSLKIYPNPFNSETTLQFEIPLGAERLILTTHNVLGQIVAQAIISVATGTFRYRYDGGKLPTGLYLLTAQAGSYHLTQKLMLLR